MRFLGWRFSTRTRTRTSAPGPLCGRRMEGPEVLRDAKQSGGGKGGRDGSLGSARGEYAIPRAMRLRTTRCLQTSKTRYHQIRRASSCGRLQVVGEGELARRADKGAGQTWGCRGGVGSEGRPHHGRIVLGAASHPDPTRRHNSTTATHERSAAPLPPAPLFVLP